MEIGARVIVASAEGIAMGLLTQTDKGVRATPKGMAYAEELWKNFTDLDKLLLAAYLKKATPDVE